MGTRLLLVILLLCLPACASIVTGTTQTISVETKATDGTVIADASCKCVNAKGTFLVTSPGAVVVKRYYEDLVVSCAKNGFPAGTTTVKATSQPSTLGNCLIGGGVGILIDAGTGAAFDYPSIITVTMGE